MYMIYNMSGMQEGTTLICHSVDVSLLVLDEVDCKEYNAIVIYTHLCREQVHGYIRVQGSHDS